MKLGREMKLGRAMKNDLRTRIAELTDVAPPPGMWQRIRSTLDFGDGSRVADLDLPVAGSWPRRRRAYLKAAVLVLLGAAGGVAAVAPGSPIRAILGIGAGPPARAGADAARVAGVAVGVPPGGVRIVLAGAHPELRVDFGLTDADELAIEGRGAASSAAFGLGGNQLTVRGAGPGVLWIGAPAGGGAVRVIEGDRELVRSENGALVLPRDGSPGRSRVMLTLSDRSR